MLKGKAIYLPEQSEEERLKSRGELRNNFNANWPNPNAFYGHKINSMAQQDAHFMSTVGSWHSAGGGRWAWLLHFSPSDG